MSCENCKCPDECQSRKRLEGLRKLLGYISTYSNRELTLFQDIKTGEFVLTTDHFFRARENTLDELLDRAAERMKDCL